MLGILPRHDQNNWQCGAPKLAPKRAPKRALKALRVILGAHWGSSRGRLPGSPRAHLANYFDHDVSPQCCHK